MDAEIQKAGANARALGTCVTDNPYYKTDQMPAVTGQTVEDWNKKVEAWDFGWKMEDMMRREPT